MKAMSPMAGTWDRIATREELSQVFDLLENNPTARGLGRSQAAEFPVTLAASETPTASKGLWLDDSEGEPGGSSIDETLESLVELFANRSDLVN